ncbi:MAG: hypothetical protein FD138_3250, partial [Planctomycetota bacterium]
MKQVAEVATKRDFSDSVPNPKHRSRGILAGVALTIAVLLLAIFPAAATNAWARFLMPWGNTPRYTFTKIESLTNHQVVAHGEPFTVAVTLAKDTVWRPDRGEVQLGGQHPVVGRLREGGRYEFELPGQIDEGWLSVRIGDLSQRVRVQPMLRPELASIGAEVALPEYLGRTQSQHKDVRGGTISLVKGSSVTFTATASRALESAQL